MTEASIAPVICLSATFFTVTNNGTANAMARQILEELGKLEKDRIKAIGERSVTTFRYQPLTLMSCATPQEASLLPVTAIALFDDSYLQGRFTPGFSRMFTTPNPWIHQVTFAVALNPTVLKCETRRVSTAANLRAMFCQPRPDGQLPWGPTRNPKRNAQNSQPKPRRRRSDQRFDRYHGLF